LLQGIRLCQRCAYARDGREFAGSLVERGAAKGVFVTTSQFAPAAAAYAEHIPQRLILIDGEELTRLMVQYGVGVRTERTIEFRKLDLDYFEEENSAAV
jgi:restriction system protein